MAAPKLNAEQRDQLREWLGADYDTRTITAWFQERGWPSITRQTLAGYRERDGAGIQALRAARRSTALASGLAIKEERVQRLKEHADRLEEVKWQSDERGRLWNEKAWCSRLPMRWSPGACRCRASSMGRRCSTCSSMGSAQVKECGCANASLPILFEPA